MLWKWQSRQRLDQHCDGLSQTVAIRPKVDIVLRLEKEIGSTLRTVSVDLSPRPPDNICLTKIPGALPHNLVSTVCALKYFFGIMRLCTATSPGNIPERIQSQNYFSRAD